VAARPTTTVASNPIHWNFHWNNISAVWHCVCVYTNPGTHNLLTVQTLTDIYSHNILSHISYLHSGGFFHPRLRGRGQAQRTNCVWSAVSVSVKTETSSLNVCSASRSELCVCVCVLARVCARVSVFVCVCACARVRLLKCERVFTACTSRDSRC
jgi:hypothetical protein